MWFVDNSSTVLAAATTQYLLWRDKKRLAKAEQGLAAIEPLDSSSTDMDMSAGSIEADTKVSGTTLVKDISRD